MATGLFVRLTILCGLSWSAAAVGNDLYTSNAICRSNYCTNPIFPGLNDLPRLEQLNWQCSSHSAIKSYLSFCSDVIYYDSALPSPNSSSAAVNSLVQAQDSAASTMFFYHLSGMGYDAWDFQDPSKITDPCVKAVQEMVCYTYFPKAQAGCQSGQAVAFQRPCKDVCGKYLAQCQVECCDESAACVFQNTLDVGGVAMVQTGYADVLGPSNLCTGSGSVSLQSPWLLLLGLLGLQFAAGGGGDCHSAQASSEPASKKSSSGPAVGVPRLALVCLLAAAAVSMQGCDLHVQEHSVGNWRKSSDYLVRYEYVPPSGTPADAVLNSCSVPDLPSTEQCSGRGYCKAWDAAAPEPLAFCVCDRDWADPECRTQRKSQATAFALSLFGGFLGLDYFYLGFPLFACGKLFSLGGLGFWWLLDVVRTGSGPIYAKDFRAAQDLPHWVYAVSTISFFLAIGFAVGIIAYMSARRSKRDHVMDMHAAEEFHTLPKADQPEGMVYRAKAGANFEGPRGFSGYGAMLPAHHPNAGAPYAVPPPGAYGHPSVFGSV